MMWHDAIIALISFVKLIRSFKKTRKQKRKLNRWITMMKVIYRIVKLILIMAGV